MPSKSRPFDIGDHVMIVDEKLRARFGNLCGVGRISRFWTGRDRFPPMYYIELESCDWPRPGIWAMEQEMQRV